MKNLIRNGQFVCIALLGMGVFASPNASDMNHEEDVTMNFGYMNTNNLVLIKDQNGYLIYQYNVEQSGNFSKSYDLSTLPDGHYYFEIDKDTEVVIRRFTVTGGEVAFEADAAESHFKPTLYAKDKQIFISRLAPNKDGMLVRVYDKYNNLLHAEWLKDELYNNRIYDLSEINSDQYKVVFKAGDRKYEEMVNF